MITIEGKCSWFGGPNDTGVKATEGLALVDGHESQFEGLFLPKQGRRTGLARRLDPDQLYIACRWDPKTYPFLRTVTVDVTDPRHPDNIIKCRPVDWGPNKRTGRVADLSPGALKALGLETDGVVRVVIPESGDSKAAISPVPAAPKAPAIISSSVKLIRQSWPLQRDAMAFYGNPYKPGWLHANTTEVLCPWTLHMGHQPVSHILIHVKCADSLSRILAWTWEQAGKSQTEIERLHLDRYSGSYNLRPMRGGTQPSMHSYAAAIDWDDEENQQHSQHHLFTKDTLLIHAALEEGWEWGGNWSAGSIDAMHIQAARVHGG